jgi:demethyl-4-deoxygadusol synthase
VTATPDAFHVEAYEKIGYSLVYADGAFAPGNSEVADSYRSFGRCLMIVDETVLDRYGSQFHEYFDRYGIALTTFPVRIRETDKTLATLERIVDAFGEFGLVRTEPVLVVGGGLTTDVTGLACAVFRRSTNYIRVPTTLIGLIDASVAIKVAVNHGRSKNRLGAFHASQKVILDFSFLATLPIDQVRNGMAELIKIAVVGNSGISSGWRSTARTCCTPASATSTGPPSCATPRTPSPTTPSRPCSSWRCPTCRSWISTG